MFISPPKEAILNCESSEFFSVLDKPPGGQARDCYTAVMSRPGLPLHPHSEEHFILITHRWIWSWTCGLKSSPLIGGPLYNDWDKETMTLTAITSYGGKIEPLWNTQILIVTYAIRPALVINWVCILCNLGWLYRLRACHESISVSNLVGRQDS